MHICSFTNAPIVELKESMRNENGVLNALKMNPRISTFDMCEHEWLQDVIKSLEDKGLILAVKEPYPWHKWKITKAGKAAMTV